MHTYIDLSWHCQEKFLHHQWGCLTGLNSCTSSAIVSKCCNKMKGKIDTRSACTLHNCTMNALLSHASSVLYIREPIHRGEIAPVWWPSPCRQEREGARTTASILSRLRNTYLGSSGLQLVSYRIKKKEGCHKTIQIFTSYHCVQQSILLNYWRR